jgi:hypothetical protein
VAGERPILGFEAKADDLLAANITTRDLLRPFAALMATNNCRDSKKRRTIGEEP